MSHAVSIRPIKTDADLATALERLTVIFGVPEDHPDHDEYLVLADLIESYERRRHPLPPHDPLGILRRCMQTHGLSQSQVPEIGAQPVVSAILLGKRRINARMAVALGRRFGLPADAFLA